MLLLANQVSAQEQIRRHIIWSTVLLQCWWGASYWSTIVKLFLIFPAVCVIARHNNDVISVNTCLMNKLLRWLRYFKMCNRCECMCLSLCLYLCMWVCTSLCWYAAWYVLVCFCDVVANSKVDNHFLYFGNLCKAHDNWYDKKVKKW